MRHYAKSAFLSAECEVGKSHPVRRTPSGTSIVHASPTTTRCDLTWLRWVKLEIQYIRKEAKQQTYVADATRFGPCRICCRAQDMKSPSRWTHARARACVVVCVVCICVCPRLPGAGGGRAGEGCFRDTPGTPPGHPRDTPGTPPLGHNIGPPLSGRGRGEPAVCVNVCVPVPVPVPGHSAGPLQRSSVMQRSSLTHATGTKATCPRTLPRWRPGCRPVRLAHKPGRPNR